MIPQFSFRQLASFFILFFLFINTSSAQDFYTGVRSGANITNVTTDLFTGRVSKIGANCGVTLDYIFKKHWTLGLEISYTQRGFGNEFLFGSGIGFNGSQTTTNNEMVYFRYDYLALPIKVGYTFGERLFAFGSLGFVPAYLVSGKTTFENSPDINQTSKMKRTDMATQIEVGGGAVVMQHFQLYGALSYMQSFTDVNTSSYFAFDPIRNYGISVSAGIRYKL